MIELKPCPFCGGEATSLRQKLVHTEPLYSIVCKSCGASTLWQPTLSDAEEKWNRRVKDDAEIR